MSTNKLIQTQEMAINGVLSAPNSLKLATEQQLTETCNGCGAAGSWFRPPHKVWGTEISFACHIHDWMYSRGRTIEDKDEADRTMLNNINRLISRDANKWYVPTWLQRKRAKAYYEAVVHFGGEAFWAGKN